MPYTHKKRQKNKKEEVWKTIYQIYNHGYLQGEELVGVRGGKRGLKRTFYLLLHKLLNCPFLNLFKEHVFTYCFYSTNFKNQTSERTK